MFHINILESRHSTSGSGEFRSLVELEPLRGGRARYERPTPDQFTPYEVYDFPGWDGDDAAPISREVVDSARRLHAQLPRDIPPAEVAPGPDGTLGFEWNMLGPVRVVVEIGPGATVRAYRNVRGKVDQFPRELIAIGAYRITRDVFSFLNDSI